MTLGVFAHILFIYLMLGGMANYPEYVICVQIAHCVAYAIGLDVRMKRRRVMREREFELMLDGFSEDAVYKGTHDINTIMWYNEDEIIRRLGIE
jgi:hypothetical protein